MFIDVLVALGVVAAVGLVLGVLLAVLSYFFGIEDDQKVKAVRACLPGINCGACGYKGCDDYAAAVAEGKAKPNLCIPGAKACARELAELVGVEPEQPKDVVAFVHCNGNCDATSKKVKYEGVATCQAAAMIYGGPDACLYGCMGFGDCAAACPADAICVLDGIAHVDSSRCLGCGLCVTVCPKSIISLVPQETNTVVMCSSHDKGADARKACKNACIGCKKCERNCPHGAIVVKDNLAVIDYEKCTRCRKCIEGCPTECIKAVFLPDIPGND